MAMMDRYSSRKNGGIISVKEYPGVGEYNLKDSLAFVSLKSPQYKIPLS